MATLGAARTGRPHQEKQRQAGHGNVQVGGQFRARYRQVGTGQLANPVDAIDAHWLDHHRERQLGSAVALCNLGRVDQVGGDDHQRALVGNQRDQAHARQVGMRTGRAGSQEGYALLGG